MIYMLILLFILFFLIFVLNKKKKNLILDNELEELNEFKYKYKKKNLMTDNEFDFFNKLKIALPEYYIFSQVSMGAILQGDSSDFKERNRIRYTFSQKIIDYVIYDKGNKIILIIELDDKMHNTEKDLKRDSMLEQAGYKTLRFNSKNKPNPTDLRKIIIDFIK